MTRAIAVAAAFVLCALAVGCSNPHRDDSTEPKLTADAERGRELVAEFECVKCHSDPQNENPKHCTGCHNRLINSAERRGAGHRNGMGGPAGSYDNWHEHDPSKLLHFVSVPTLVGSTDLFRASWLSEFLLKPHDLRPRLGETMPQLPLEPQQARDIVAYLTELNGLVKKDPYFTDAAIANYDKPHPPLERGDAKRGRERYRALGCASCHVFSGVVPADFEVRHDKREPRMLELAPDLRNTRDRFKPQALVPWLLEPRYHKADAEMPQITMSYQEARDLAAFVMDAPLGPAAAPPTRPVALPDLERPVRFDEVELKVLGKICVHCHAGPHADLGDGGPGFAGGFGFKRRAIDLSDYEAVFSGMIGDDGKRHSLFEPVGPRSAPRLVAALWARWDEVAGIKEESAYPVRGMPLGLPPLSAEEIQLVSSWIAQGRPR